MQISTESQLFIRRLIILQLIIAVILDAYCVSAESYSLATNYSVGSNPVSICLGNLRGKKLFRDLAVANFNDNSVGVRLCLDDGTFGRLDTYLVGINPASVRYGDFNRDGQDDLVTANSGSNTVSVLMNAGVGANFRTATNYVVGNNALSGPTDAYPADINEDGRIDLVTANFNENSISVLTNAGNGAFLGLTNYTVSGGPVSLAVTDINLDGLPDIVTANKTAGSFSILIARKDVQPAQTNRYFELTQTTSLGSGSQPVCLVARDINADGAVDLVVANRGSNCISVLIGTNALDGSWGIDYRDDFLIPTDNALPSSLVVRDLNRDGVIDIAVACAGDTNVWVYLGRGDGRFDLQGAFPTAGGGSVAIAGSNFNADDATDLAVANFSSNTVSVLLYGGPLAYDFTRIVNEDVPTSVALRGALLGGGSFTFVTNTIPGHGSLSGSLTNLVYTPQTNFFGVDSFTYSTIDHLSVSTSVVATVTLTVLPVNDSPSFNLSAASVSVIEDSLMTNFPAIITNISTGPANESSQNFSFITTTTSNAFFMNLPVISPSGTLTFRPALNKVGTVQVMVQMRDNGGTLRSGVSLSVTQTINIVVTANPIKPLRGVYSGLYYEPSGVRSLAAGFFTFTLTAKGGFTGRLMSESGGDAFAGRFDLTGHAQVFINRRNNSNVQLDMQLDVNGGSDQVTGSVTDGNWTADLFGDRVIFNAQVNPAPQAGRYTVVLPGYANAAVAPAGNGYGAVTIGLAGNISVSGRLGDNTAFAQATGISKNGEWPLYAPLYGGRGLVLGWVTVTNRLTNSLEGKFTWINTTLAGNYYPAGFDFSNSIMGSTYTAPGGQRALALTNCSVIINGGNLIGSYTNGALYTETNTVVANDISQIYSQLKFSSLVTGVLGGSFSHPDIHLTRAFYGVVLQQQNTARGYFLGTNQSGAFLLRGN